MSTPVRASVGAPVSEPFYFVRHGQTEWNVQGRFQGRTDIPLNGRGREDAHTAGRLLAHFFARRKHGPALVVASPLVRAMDTARILCSHLGLDASDIVPDARLMEQNYGEWEGRTLEEIRSLFPGSAERQFAAMRLFTADGGESMDEVRRRVLSCVAALPAHSLVVGHFGTLFALMLSLRERDAAQLPKIRQGAFYVLDKGKLFCFSEDGDEMVLS